MGQLNKNNNPTQKQKIQLTKKQKPATINLNYYDFYCLSKKSIIFRYGRENYIEIFITQVGKIFLT